jgi:hypothetical protein
MNFIYCSFFFCYDRILTKGVGIVNEKVMIDSNTTDYGVETAQKMDFLDLIIVENNLVQVEISNEGKNVKQYAVDLAKYQMPRFQSLGNEDFVKSVMEWAWGRGLDAVASMRDDIGLFNSIRAFFLIHKLKRQIRSCCECKKD